MTLKKVQLKAGVNKENTRYTNENGWYSCDKIRFRQGTPEKIGGWTRSSTGPYLGVCRALFAWSTLTGDKNIGVGILRDYLRFAESRGANLGPSNALPPVLNPFEIHVRDELVRAGLRVIPQYGVSGYRIDFAVTHPAAAGTFVLAVECDGEIGRAHV